MLQPEQAKSKFRGLLLWILLAVLWPVVAVALFAVLALLGLKSLGLAAFLLVLVWLGLFIWLVVSLWRVAPEIGVTPWASLWLLLPWIGLFFVGMLFLEPLKYIGDNKPADKRLPATWGLIKDSVRFGFNQIAPSFKTTRWFLFISLGLGVTAGLMSLWAPFGILYFFVAIGSAIASVWVTIKYLLEIACVEAGGQPTGKEGESAKGKILTYFVMALIVAFITAGPMLAAIFVSVVLAITAGAGMSAMNGGGGSSSAGLMQLLANSALPIILVALVFVVLFVASFIWAIYKSNQYSFAFLNLVLDNDKLYYTGTMQSLNASSKLIKGRWWGALWKTQLFGMTVGLVVGLAMQMVLMVLIGVPAIFIRDQNVYGAIVNFFTGAVQGGIQIVLIPLVFSFQIKMYRAFKRISE